MRKPGLLLAGVLLAVFSVRGQTYSDICGPQGINFVNQVMTSYGSGVSLVDFDGDGWDDMSLATGWGDSLQFYRNVNGNFIRVPAFVSHTGEAMHLMWVDYDNDGDKDLYVSSNLGSNRLYRNDSGNFTDVTAAVGLATDNTETYGAAWGDINNDGWLDLYEGNQLNFGGGHNRLYLNDGSGNFTEIAAAANAQDSVRYAFAVAFVDYDQDGWQDIFIANDRMQQTTLLRNLGDSSFADVSAASGAGLTADGMSATVGDYDNNGYQDFYVTNTQAGNLLYHNLGNGNFIEMADSLGVSFNSETWSAQFFDYDLDGDLDLHVCDIRTGSYPQKTFFENADTAFFQPTGIFPGDTLRNFSSAVGDFNNDGYPDLVSPNVAPSAMQMWQNSGGSSNSWLKVDLEGQVTNRDGIGTQVEIFANGQRYVRYSLCGSGYLSQNSRSLFFGLAQATLIDSARVKWLSGHIDQFYNWPVNQRIKLTEGDSYQRTVQTTGATLRCTNDTVPTRLAAPGGFASYQWNTGDSLREINVYTAGSFYWQATDSLGLVVHSDTLRIEEDSLVITTQSWPDTNQNGVGAAEVQITHGTPPYQILWDDPQQQTTTRATGLTPGWYSVVVTDSLQCRDSLAIEVGDYRDMALVRHELKGVVLFPNPVIDQLHLRWEGPHPGMEYLWLELWDIHQRSLHRQFWDHQQAIQLSFDDYPSGIYMLRITTTPALDAEATYRVVKK